MAIRGGRLVYKRILQSSINARDFMTNTIERTSHQLNGLGGSLLKANKKPNLPALINHPTSFLHTSGMKGSTCIPTQLPPKCGPTGCVIPKPNIWKDCKVRKRPQWKGCEKICMPCCCPAYSPPDCEQIEIKQNTCKRLEYRIPSFSECRKYPLGIKLKKECCTSGMPCPEAGLENLIVPLISTKTRQETILGRRTGSIQARGFSTSAVAMKQPDSDPKKSSKKACEKQCMPCCAPARDPPDCNYPAAKIECKRLKPPRPAFSECNKEKMKKVEECDCRVNLVPCLNKMESSQKSC